MRAKPVVLRARANQDVLSAIDYYTREAGEDVSLDFVARLERRLEAIGQSPGLGSTRYAHELDLPGLRSRSLKPFPYLVFYIEFVDHVDVWRILHSARDIPAWLLNSEPED